MTSNIAPQVITHVHVEEAVQQTINVGLQKLSLT